MVEKHSLDDFDLGDFFDCVALHGMKGALALRQPELPAPPEDTTFAFIHRDFQTKFMREFFAGKTFQSMNAIAREFTEQFNATKQEIIAYSPDELEQKLYKETTIKTMAAVAKQNLEEAKAKSARSIQGSSDNIRYRGETDSWTLIAQIVDLAVELEK